MQPCINYMVFAKELIYEMDDPVPISKATSALNIHSRLLPMTKFIKHNIHINTEPYIPVKVRCRTSSAV